MREKVSVVGAPSHPGDLLGIKCLHWSLIPCILVLAALAHRSASAETSPPKTGLVLFSSTDRWAQNYLQILKATARSHASLFVDFHVENLGSARFGDPSSERAMRQSLASLYNHKRIDLGIPVFYLALRFALDHRQKLFSGTPITFYSVPSKRLQGQNPGPGVTGIAIVAYRQQTVWQRRAKYIAVVLALILLQTALIIVLLLQRARRQKADLPLRESEQRFRLIADTTPALVWMCDKNGDVTYLNNRRIDFTGGDLAGDLADVWSSFIHPEDLQGVRAANAKALQQQKGFSKEYRLRRRDGAYRWMLDIAAPRVNGNGLFAGFIGSAADITDQKVAREALEKIGGKLIEAQEEERTRIARELHDDICQRLALLSMELEQANRGSNASSGSLKIEEIRRHCAEIACDVQALSHKLHSSKLEYLGLVAAIRSFCREFCQQHNVWIEFEDQDIPSSLPRDISLSIFRVTQEALQNALKYSGVRQFSVSLRGSAGEIQLEVSDHGVGFDVETAMRDKGLGLVSMQERVHLVHGIFVIQSTMEGGTRILARVPLGTEMPASESTAETA